ncbi:MAG: fused MFS/spermidine synthase [Alphaproteobacteria bacterium]|nr:fused MFS/spermidine synthase [Alphaproteobacteria bacterium]
MNAIREWLNPRVAMAATNERLTLVVFTMTIFLSALLLFAVQPMFARMVLPKLGGSPSVWAVSMVFFQAALLGGYTYAHLLNRYLGSTQALLTHLALLVVALFALPIALPSFAAEPPPGDAYMWLIGVLTVGVGLPFFAVSANAPLLQSWFARSGHSHADDPYFLYGASNVGSMLALLSYPVLLEPVFGLGEQAMLWTIGFAMLATLIAACGSLMLVGSAANDTQIETSKQAASPAVAETAVTSRDRAVWIALAFVPSALLVAFTTFLTTDIASAPFLWVLPLAAFLGTFIITFRDQPLIPHGFLLNRQAMIVGLAIFATASVSAMAWNIAMAASLASFLLVTLVCHRELYLRRPAASKLTEFYLLMSLGGVLGGIFAALIAPQIFTTIFEFPLLLAASLLMRPDILDQREDRQSWLQAAGMVAVAAAVLLLASTLISWGIVEGHMKLRVVVVAMLFAGLLYFAGKPARRMAVVATMLLAILILPEGRNESHAVRSFFGVHRVIETPDGTLRLLMHGTTVHGAERLIDEAGNKVAEPIPSTYYHPQSPMARTLDLVRNAKTTDGKVEIGIVGLGAGAMACHKKANDNWKFYEIDQAVVDIARDKNQFGYMSTCQPDAPVIVGDARLTLTKEAAGAFNYLLIDAFSSDAIPMHLLTVEAFKLYVSKLAPGGVLAIHLSNKHLDLPPAVTATIEQIDGLNAVLVNDKPENPGFDSAPSTVMLISRDKATIEPAMAWQGAEAPKSQGVSAWTDDYSDIVTTLLRGWFKTN